MDLIFRFGIMGITETLEDGKKDFAGAGEY